MCNKALLADNGGSTETIALRDAAENPALDAIPAEDCTDTEGVPVTVDQRGVSRPQPADGDCDVGAFELVQEAPITIADRTDGAFPPPDFVQGPTAPDLLDAITEVQDELGCFA